MSTQRDWTFVCDGKNPGFDGKTRPNDGFFPSFDGKISGPVPLGIVPLGTEVAAEEVAAPPKGTGHLFVIIGKDPYLNE